MQDDTGFLQHENICLDASQLPFSLEVDADESYLQIAVKKCNSQERKVTAEILRTHSNILSIYKNIMESNRDDTYVKEMKVIVPHIHAVSDYRENRLIKVLHFHSMMAECKGGT